MAEQVYQGNTKRGEGAVEQISRDVYRVPSLTIEGKFYRVDLDALTCGCPHYTEGHVKACKHIVLADAVAAIPVGVGASVATERVVDLCRGIFAKNLGRLTSYQVLTETLHSPHATEAMRTAAIQRHARRAA